VANTQLWSRDWLTAVLDVTSYGLRQLRDEGGVVSILSSSQYLICDYDIAGRPALPRWIVPLEAQVCRQEHLISNSQYLYSSPMIMFPVRFIQVQLICPESCDLGR
jgi:hypothetical protein